ncbi:hypothetical protein [Legionella sp. CNM-4043-24]|uniref:hypothetical protein n=1 Tax=Legionella sp. CNM-4043-24 TaxID=3421646 RepID=UPI00403B2145
MKTIIFVFSILFSCQLQAVVCKCECDPKNLSFCASSYDLDNPCNGVCPSQGNMTTPPARTACPMVQVFDQLRGKNVWYSTCND